MHRFFVPGAYAEEMTITGVDAKHIYTVLRMKPNDKVQVVSGDGVTAIAEIISASSDKVDIRSLEVLSESHETEIKIVLAQGLAKGEKMDFITQKAVELGAYKIVPLAMEHSVVKLTGDKAEKKRERWQKIAEAAAKQCKRDIVPEVAPVQTLAELLAKEDFDIKILAYECEDKLGLKTYLQGCKDYKNVLVIVGPEGGISPSEVAVAQKSGVALVSLGKRILRAETAALTLLSALLYEFDELGG